MKKVQVLLAIVLAAVLMGCVTRVVSPLPTPAPAPEISLQGIGRRPLTPYLAYYEVAATADNWAILVDLSDRAHYPHALTNRIILKSLHYAGDLNLARRWHWNVGVVTAVTTATTDVEWIAGGDRTNAVEFDERWQLPEHGLSLSVVGATLDRVATFEITSTAAITSDTEISTTIGITGTVGVGDLILFMDEISDTTTLHFNISAGYDTE